ncbi:MAG TPA: endolytic transglycosylase MltG [Acidimicrobiales bacterium]|nr:endolytic transglycosylase MltG [Acidimicrobiales bacterium]
MNPRRRWPLILGALMLTGFVSFAAVAMWFQRNVSPPGDPGKEVSITVEPGMSSTEIGRLLEQEGVIGSASVFRYYLRVNGLGTVEAGDYTLHEKEDMGRVVEVLEGGAKVDKGLPLTIPEGLTVKEVAQLVGTLPGRSAERFLQVAASGVVTSRYQGTGVRSLEGLLLPETYFFVAEDDETAILRRMVESFDAVATRLDITGASARLGVTPYEAVVIASMVEREARVDEDRGKVARVIYNRLEAEMPMQIDATVQFALGKQKEVLLLRDLEIDSPYNTYRNAGLPPGPIAAPGQESLAAALAPTPGPWIYFVVIDDNGRHEFAETLVEHNRNIARAEQNGVR